MKTPALILIHILYSTNSASTTYSSIEPGSSHIIPFPSEYFQNFHLQTLNMMTVCTLHVLILVIKTLSIKIILSVDKTAVKIL